MAIWLNDFQGLQRKDEKDDASENVAGENVLQSDGITAYDFGLIATLCWHFLLIVQPASFFLWDGSVVELIVLWGSIACSFLVFLFVYGRVSGKLINSGFFRPVVLLFGVFGSLGSFVGGFEGAASWVVFRIALMLLQGVSVAFLVSLWLQDYLHGEGNSLDKRILLRFMLGALLALVISCLPIALNILAGFLPILSAALLVVSGASSRTAINETLSEGDSFCRLASATRYLRGRENSPRGELRCFRLLYFILPAFAIGLSFGLLKVGVYGSGGVLSNSSAVILGSAGIASSFIIAVAISYKLPSTGMRVVLIFVSWCAVFAGIVLSLMNESMLKVAAIDFLLTFGISTFDFCLMTAAIDYDNSGKRDLLENMLLNRVANYSGVTLGMFAALVLVSFFATGTSSGLEIRMVFALVAVFMVAVGLFSSVSALAIFVPRSASLKEGALKSDPEVVSFVDAVDFLSEEAGLTRREREVFERLARGRNVSHISEELVISRQTTKTHVSRIYRKIGVHSHQELLTLVDSKRAGEN